MIFTWVLLQIPNVLQWTVGSTVRYRKSDKWMVKIVYSKLKVGSLLQLRRVMLSHNVSKGY